MVKEGQTKIFPKDGDQNFTVINTCTCIVYFLVLLQLRHK